MDLNRINKESDGGLRVLFIVPDALMGGSSRSLLQLILELREKYNVHPTVIIPKTKRVGMKLADKCRENGIAYYNFRFYWFKGIGIKQYAKFLLNRFVLFPIILFHLRSLNFDIVHSNSSVIDLGGVISRNKGIKHIWHLREFGSLDFGLHSGFGRLGDSLIYKMGDVFIAISESVKSAFVNVIPESKIKVIYNGVKIQPESLDAIHNNQTLQFVMIGTIQNSKNQLEALKAFSLLKKRGKHAHLHFVGPENEIYKSVLNKYIVDNSLVQDVTFWGECDNVPQILSKMDVGLMLSNSEAFGRVTVEYMIQNLAVIASDKGANPEIVTDGETGFLYQLGNIEELANKMCFCIDNRDKMMYVACKGKKVAFEKFNSEENSKNIYKIYKNLSNMDPS